MFLTYSVFAQEPFTAKDIIDKSRKATKLAGVESAATLIIIDGKGRERIRKNAQISKLYDNGKTEKKLFKFISPADVKGTGLLTFDYEDKDDDMWLFMPALRKTRRIVSSDKAKRFMGSEFSYADISPPPIEEFAYKIIAEENVSGIECWKIEILPLNDDIADENGFSKKMSWIGKNDFVIRKALYYDLGEEIHKEMGVREIKELDTSNHKYKLMHMIMVNKQNNRKSVLKVDKVKFNPNIKDDYFTTRYLERK